MDTHTLAPAMDLAIRNGVTFPHESDEYRSARTMLLAEEIELRRHIERVAQMRRALPAGGKVKNSYRFEGENGPASFEDLFGDKETLVVYCWMYGPERERPCPMCTSQLSAWDGEAPDIMQRVGLAVIARSPIDKLLAFRNERGWRHLPVYSDLTDEFSRDFHSTGADGKEDNPGFHVFTRRDGTIRHFWSEEMGAVTADPGQDPRGAAEVMPLWTILDTTPEGRAPNWYPKLSY